MEGADILETIEGAKDLEAELMKEVMARKEEHEHHHHEHGEECHGHHHEHDEECHGHHHDHDEECHEHHHDHEHDEECHGHHHEHDEECHGHHHDHDHDEECHEHHHEHGEECHHHHHEHDEDGHGHHHHHHADEVFTSWGIETPASYTQSEIEQKLKELEKEDAYGIVLRAKGMVPAGDGTWVYFDYVPEECDIRSGKPDVTGKICVIGSKLKEDNLAALFQK